MAPARRNAAKKARIWFDEVILRKKTAPLADEAKPVKSPTRTLAQSAQSRKKKKDSVSVTASLGKENRRINCKREPKQVAKLTEKEEAHSDTALYDFLSCQIRLILRDSVPQKLVQHLSIYFKDFFVSPSTDAVVPYLWKLHCAVHPEKIEPVYVEQVKKVIDTGVSSVKKRNVERIAFLFEACDDCRCILLVLLKLIDETEIACPNQGKSPFSVHSGVKEMLSKGLPYVRRYFSTTDQHIKSFLMAYCIEPSAWPKMSLTSLPNQELAI